MPEARHIFHRHCSNLQGKGRLERNDFPGVLGRVRPGVRQVFERIDVEGSQGMGGDAAVDELEARLEWLTKKVDREFSYYTSADIRQTIPTLLRSAVSRESTMIIIPSYFDFVRVTNHLRKADIVSFASISEYLLFDSSHKRPADASQVLLQLRDQSRSNPFLQGQEGLFARHRTVPLLSPLPITRSQDDRLLCPARLRAVLCRILAHSVHFIGERRG